MEDARTAVRNAPVEVAIGVLTAGSLSFAIETDTLERWSRIAVVAAIAFPLVFTASALYTAGVLNAARRYTVTFAGLAAAAAYAFLVFDPEVPAEAWRA